MIGNAWMSSVEYLTLVACVVIPATLYASWIDYKERRVPNWLNGALALSGWAAQAAYHGWSGLQDGLLGAAVGLACLIVPWAMHGMGAGDVKLMAAIGAWFGPVMCFWGFVTGVLVGGVIAVAMIALQGKWRCAATNLGTILAKVGRLETAFGEFGSARSFGTTSSLLPYGIPLTIGSWMVLAAQMSGWWRVV